MRRALEFRRGGRGPAAGVLAALAAAVLLLGPGRATAGQAANAPAPALADKAPAKAPAPVTTKAAAGESQEAPAAAEPATRVGTYYPRGIEAPRLARPMLLAMNVLKVILLAVLAGAVFYVANWAFLDTRFVNANGTVWGGVVLGGGLAGLAAAALVPFFYVGLPLGVVLCAGAAVAYATHRNALVTPPLRVLTTAHLKRLRRRLKGRKPFEDAETGPVTGVGRDIILVGLDDLPKRPEGGSPEESQAGQEVERVLYDAIVRRASVVGFVGRPQKGEIRFRIDGEMTAGDDIEPPAADHFSAVVKRLAGLDPQETRRPQEGRLRAVVAGQAFDLRIRTSGTVRGEQVAIRIIDIAASQRRLEDLGLPEDSLAALAGALARRPGLVLLSSPKDSGLTTTLHACLRHFDRYVSNVILFEPHVDMEIENVAHIPLDQESGPVAVAEVRSRIRMDPDVVGIDSLYQGDVAQLIVEAAREHTVLVGIRAADATQALMRFSALAGSPESWAPRLQIVVNQRLVRLLCPECKEAYRPNPEFIRKANLGSRRVDVLYRPPTRAAVQGGKVVPCRRCHNDRYVGRTGIFELMPVDDEIREMIVRGASLTDLRTYSRRLGMRNLQEEALGLVIAGETSIDEVLRAIKSD